MATIEEYAKKYTIEMYMTPKEIEYRSSIIEQNGLNFNDLMKMISEYRKKNRHILLESNGRCFSYTMTKELRKRIEKINGFWRTVEYMTQTVFAKNLIMDTLIAEAYHSSTIEGAHTTYKRTEELIKEKLSPKDRSEQMVVNNFHGLEFAEKEKKIDIDFLLKLHKIVTENTLEQREDEGKFRNGPVDIRNAQQKVIFSPVANIKTMRSMLDDMLSFVNEEDDFKQPVECIVKAMTLHFLYGFIHPHFDGNGRTLRILFTQLLIGCGYDMFRYITLSEIILEERKEYEKAFIDVERNKVDSNTYDLTYFFYFLTDIMLKALDRLALRIEKYTLEDRMKKKIKKLGIVLTPLQERIIRSVVRSQIQMDIKTLAKRLKVSSTTIRKHISVLTDTGLLKRKRIGRSFYYFPNPEIES